MDEVRQRHHRRWLASLDLAALRQRAAEQGIAISDEADHDTVVNMLLNAGAGPGDRPQGSSAQPQGLQEGSSDVAAQIRADEELARRLMADGLMAEASEDGATISSASEPAASQDEAVAAQILADEELARRLADEDSAEPRAVDESSFRQIRSSGGGDRIGYDEPTVSSVVQALEALQPLRARRQRRGGQRADLLDNVFRELEEHIAAMNTASSSYIANAGTGGYSAAASSSAAPAAGSSSSPPSVSTSSTSSAPATGSAAGASTADLAMIASRLSEDVAAAEAVQREVESTVASPPDEPRSSASGAERRTPASRRYEEYMAGVDARREAARRRREEFLAQMNNVLEQAATGGLGGLVAAADHAGGAAAVPSAAPRELISANTTTSVWEGPDDTQCVICCEDLAQGDEVRTLRCGHIYHKDCIDVWLRRSRLCCLCKQPIDGSSSTGDA